MAFNIECRIGQTRVHSYSNKYRLTNSSIPVDTKSLLNWQLSFCLLIIVYEKDPEALNGVSPEQYMYLQRGKLDRVQARLGIVHRYHSNSAHVIEIALGEPRMTIRRNKISCDSEQFQGNSNDIYRCSVIIYYLELLHCYFTYM